MFFPFYPSISFSRCSQINLVTVDLFLFLASGSQFAYSTFPILYITRTRTDQDARKNRNWIMNTSFPVTYETRHFYSLLTSTLPLPTTLLCLCKSGISGQKLPRNQTSTFRHCYNFQKKRRARVVNACESLEWSRPS